jgi:type IV secretion system protein VirB4
LVRENALGASHLERKVIVLNLLEYRTKEEGLADRLNYAAMIDTGIMCCKDGALMACWYFLGQDLASSTADELAAVSARLNASLRFGSGWMIHVDAIRRKAPGYPERGAFPDRTTRVIDEERRMQFLAEGAHYESAYALSLTYLPPTQTEGKLTRMMFDGDDGAATREVGSRYLRQFRDACAEVEDSLSSIFLLERMDARELVDEFGRSHMRDAMLQYLQFCVTGENHPVNLPPWGMYLDTLVGNADFYGGIAPRVGKKHVRVVALDGFPQESYPGILAALDELALEYRWSTRFQFLDGFVARGLLDGMRRKWKQKVRGFKDQMFQTANGSVNLDAAEMSNDVEMAMGEADSGLVRYGYYTSNIVIYDEDPEQLDEAVREIRKIVQNLGFGARLETINAVEAWFGSLPGHGVENIRRPLLHTLNLADLLPSTAIWAGLAVHPCPFYAPNSPPLAYAATNGSTPFRLNAHVSDVGHMLGLGPTGAGKTTLLAFLVGQQFRYPGAQVFAFDMKYGLYALVKAAGGDHYDIGREKTKLAFCPLKEIDSRSDFAWAAEWIETLCTLQGLDLTPAMRNKVAQGLELLKASPTRTLTEFVANVQDLTIREALEHYTVSGPMGSLLDAEVDTLGSSKFMVFEMEELMALGDKNVVPVLLYLFRRIEKRLDGSPTVLSIDEAWLALSHPMFQDKLREWLKLLRSKNCAVWMFTQSLSDVFNSPIRDVIVESCLTKILLPNAEARNEASRGIYQVLGLNQRQIDIIASATPKRHYYYMSALGRRLFQLGLGGVALSFLGVSGKEDTALIDKFIAQHGERWPAEWLRHRGYADWADYWLRLNPSTLGATA